MRVRKKCKAILKLPDGKNWHFPQYKLDTPDIFWAFVRFDSDSNERTSTLLIECTDRTASKTNEFEVTIWPRFVDDLYEYMRKGERFKIIGYAGVTVATGICSTGA